MADVLIMGMKMPKDGVYWCEIGIAGEIATITIHGEDRKSFPLLPLPDGHGKLGDLDALDKFIHEKETKAAAEEFYLGEAWYNTFRQIVRLMQTIVPPEGGTDNG